MGMQNFSVIITVIQMWQVTLKRSDPILRLRYGQYHMVLNTYQSFRWPVYLCKINVTKYLLYNQIKSHLLIQYGTGSSAYPKGPM